MLRAATNCTARRPFVSGLSRCLSRGSLESGLVGVHGDLFVRCSVCFMCVSLSFPTPPATAAQCGYLLCPWSFGLCLQASPTLLNLVMASLSLVRLASVHIEKWLHFLIWRTRITAGQHSLTDVVSNHRLLQQHCENSMCEHKMAVALLSARAKVHCGQGSAMAHPITEAPLSNKVKSLLVADTVKIRRWR